MWAAAEAHLIFVGYVDVGRVTRSRPTCIVNGHPVVRALLHAYQKVNSNVTSSLLKPT
jgi:hypothetical protein